MANHGGYGTTVDKIRAVIKAGKEQLRAPINASQEDAQTTIMTDQTASR
jgi:hypothetical protein